MDTLWQAYAAITLSAVVPIWFGSHASVSPVAKSKKRRTAGTIEDGDSDSEEEDVERMSMEDAMWFPVLGSGVLFGLFILFKYLDKRLINLLLSGYFGVLGTAGLTRMFVSFTRSFLGPSRWSKTPKYRVRLTKNNSEVLGSFRFTQWHLGWLVVGAAISGAEWYSKNWVVSDLVALAFAFNAISLLKLDSFKTGSMLLGGLFVYDIWWVFGSSHAFGENVMVSVAKNFEAPIKIVWPKDLAALLAGRKTGYTMLGLGDIVIPGVFVALALRFDHHNAVLAQSTASSPRRRKLASFPRGYFLACMASYVVGLATTIFVMHRFEAAQPALLYLSPACTGSVIAVAALKGQLSRFWTWNDGDDLDSTSSSADQPPNGDTSARFSKAPKTGPLAEGMEIPNPLLAAKAEPRQVAGGEEADTEGDESEQNIRRSPRKRKPKVLD